jgi:hypothetical protein
MKQCPECSAELDTGADTCWMCGETQPDAKISSSGGAGYGIGLITRSN